MAEWLSQLADLDICFGPVASVSEMLDDPQVRHRQMVLEFSDRRGERRRTLGNPIKLSADGPTIRTPPPELGEHTDAVLTELGYTPAQIIDLRTRGIV
jgi:crotonobetainyl-CoA:carnitine CoA-transferase CaiB-like acyl-CoA transferase